MKSNHVLSMNHNITLNRNEHFAVCQIKTNHSPIMYVSMNYHTSQEMEPGQLA